MSKVKGESSGPTSRGRFPRLRKSRSAEESLAVELARLRKMSIEQRMMEALSLQTALADLQPVRERDT